MKQEQIVKPEKPRSARTPPARPDRASNSGASAGLPVFLKEAQTKRDGAGSSDPLEQDADAIAKAAVSGENKRNVDWPTEMGSTGTDIPAVDGGSPLHDSIRRRVEPAVGADLSQVRVHDADADRGVAAGLGARAFTHGQDIWMGPDESSSDLQLMAHESAHVVQQGATPSAPSIQKQQQQTPVSAGTTEQMAFFVDNPQVETETSLRTVLTMLNRYRPTVDVFAVEFRVMTTVQSYVGTGLFEEGRSHWEGSKPVIELTQEKYDIIAQHFANTAAVSDVHEVIRTIGHELYHLDREKTGNQSNPVEPLFAAEASKRMEKIRQNWVEWAKDPGGHRALGIAPNKPVNQWEDIPPAERAKIEAGASDTGEIQGLYERTAYLVEETYVRIEELSYLRVQQQAETGPKRPSQSSISQIANLIWRFNTALDQSVGAVDFMTPEVLAKTKAAMLDFLRKRYPHRADPSVDSFEVIFYLAARTTGLAPIYDDSGALISAVPTGARVK